MLGAGDRLLGGRAIAAVISSGWVSHNRVEPRRALDLNPLPLAAGNS